MGQIWDYLIIQPFAWLLRTFFNFTNSYGGAIILFALAAKLILLFFAYKGKRGMLQQQRIQPKLKELEAKYKGDKEKYNQAVAKFYQDEGISPMGGCLWTLLPFPVMIALFTVVRNPISNIMRPAIEGLANNEVILKIADALNAVLARNGQEVINTVNNGYLELSMAQKLYENFGAVNTELYNLGLQVTGMREMDFRFLGLNLAEIPPWPWQSLSLLIIIPLVSALTSYLSTWFTNKFSGMQAPQGNMKMMVLMGPVMSLWFGFIMPAGMGVYWIAQNLLGVVQEYFLTKHFTKVLDAEDAKKAELEARRKAAEEAQRAEDRARRSERIAAQQQKHKPKKYKLSQSSSKPAALPEDSDESMHELEEKDND